MKRYFGCESENSVGQAQAYGQYHQIRIDVFLACYDDLLFQQTSHEIESDLMLQMRIAR